MKRKLLLNYWFFFLGLCFVSTLTAQVNLADGLVAYYPLNGNANDFSGNNNNGTPFDNVSYITDAFGNTGGAASFGGTANQGRISINHSASLNFSTGASFSFWARISNSTGTFGNGSVGAGGSHCFFAKAADAGGGFWQLANIQGADLRHQIGNNGVAALTGLFNNYTLNQWIHYTVTMDATGHRTFINGVLQTSNTIAANFGAMSNRPLVLGRFNTNWYPLNGAIDEFRVYNRVLTNDEITALANNDLGEVTLTYNNITTPCAGDQVSVTAQSTGTFAPNNQFLVQLSDRNGSFTNPIVIRRINGIAINETIQAQLPFGLPSGTQYRLRLVSTAPQETSAAGAAFSINGVAGNLPDPALFTYIGSLNGRDYFRSTAAQNYTNARNTCLNNGGHLATIPNAEVNQLIQQNAGNAPVYIGVNDIQTEGLFVFENGNRLTYTNWSVGEPNNSGNEDIVELRNDNGLWNDGNGNTARFYFLELNPAGINRTICEGGAITLQAPTLAGATYQWTGPNGFSAAQQAPVLSNISIQQAGVYTLQYTLNGCTSQAYQTRINVIPLPKNTGEIQIIPASLAQGLQLYFPMNGNGNDSSANNINATIVGGVTPTTNRFGQENTALQLNGTNGHLTLPAGVYFNGSDFSITAWVRKVSNNNWSRLLDFGNGQANQNVLLAISNGTTGRPAAQVYLGNAGGLLLTSPQAIPDNQWQMLTYTWANGGGQLFVNGVLVAQGPQNTPENVVRTLNYIGRSNWSGDGFANASIDELRVYNRVLSPEEIQLLALEQSTAIQIAPQNAQVCNGQTTNILVQNSQPGIVYQLRLNSNNTAVGAAQTGTGATLTFALPAITATTTYNFLVRNTALACAEIVTAPITVTVNPLPQAPTTTGGAVCNQGSVTLQAQGAPANGFYNWYTTATGGTPIAGQNTNTFIAPESNVTRTYFVSITDANGCESTRTAVVAQITNALAPAVDINSGLLLYNKFDNNALDSSGNNLNGNINGSLFSYEEDRLGNPQSALSITNGTFVDYGNPSSVQQLTNQVTIALWIKQDPSNFGQFTPLLNKWQGNGLYLALDSFQTVPPGPMNQNRVRWRVNNSVFLNSNVNVLHNQWHHIVVTYNGAQLRIYQNGQLTGQLNHNGTITNNSASLQFGRQANGLGDAPYRGDADEMRLYNRALSPDEVRTLFNNESVAFANGPLCDGQNELTLTTVTIPGATYQWTGPNGFSSTQQNPPSIPQADAATYAGEYTVVITNPNGCISTPQKVNVVINPIPQAPTVQNATVCGSGNATLQVLNPPAGASFRWYLDATGGSPIAGATAATFTINNVTQNTIRYVSVVQNNCEGPRVPVTAFYFSTVNTGLTLTGSTVCASATTATVTVPQSENGVSYQAFLGTTAVSDAVVGNGNQVQLSINATLLALGANTLTIRANFPSCGPVNMQQQPQVTRNQETIPTITANGSVQLCAGESVVLQASAGNAYLWSTGETTSSITINTAGSYTVTVTDANGCSATSTATTVTLTPIPTPTITVNGATTLCAGETTQLQASGGTTYLWSTGATTPTITVSQAGTYSVTAFNGNCQATSSSVSVTVTPIPTPTITVNGATTLCAGETTQLQASGGTTYLWSTGATTPTITVSQAGTYSVTAFNGNCQATSSSISVTVTPIPTPTITVNGATTLCAGETTQLQASGGTTYLWSTGATTPTITVSQAGTYSVTAFNGNCQATSSSVSVTVTPIPTPTITVNGATTLCAGETTQLQASGGTTYLWSTGATTPTITVSQAGTYSVTAFNGNCQATSSSVSVTVTPLPETPGAISGSTTICENSSQTYSINPVAGATSYQWLLPSGWSGASTGTSITITSSTQGGVVRVKALNSCGESNEQVITVSVVEIATQVLLSGATLSAQQPNATYQWITCDDSQPIVGATNAQYTATQDGSYAVLITLNGCTKQSECVDITTLNVVTPEATWAIRAFPNPANTITNLRIDPAPAEVVTLQLFTMLGQEVQKQTATSNPTGTYTLNLDPLPQGQYIVKISTQTATATLPILKQ